jgi:hypothetical protein
MKSQIFTKAWQLVKEMGISLSNALKIAWAEFKLEAMCIVYNAGGCNDYQLEKKIDAQQVVLNKIKPCNIEYKWNRKPTDNSGAEAWYNTPGVYNGD